MFKIASHWAPILSHMNPVHNPQALSTEDPLCYIIVSPTSKSTESSIHLTLIKTLYSSSSLHAHIIFADLIFGEV